MDQTQLKNAAIAVVKIINPSPDVEKIVEIYETAKQAIDAASEVSEHRDKPVSNPLGSLYWTSGNEQRQRLMFTPSLSHGLIRGESVSYALASWMVKAGIVDSIPPKPQKGKP